MPAISTSCASRSTALPAADEPARSAAPGVSELIVRDATADDVVQIASVHLDSAMTAYRDIFPDSAPAPTYEELLSRWSEWIRNATATDRNLLAVFESTPTGIARAGADPSDPSVGHLSRLYVRSTSWGHGIGSALFVAALDHLRSAGFGSATLWVLEGNTRARSWYERLGWVPTGQRKTVFEPASIDDIGYRIDL